MRRTLLPCIEHFFIIQRTFLCKTENTFLVQCRDHFIVILRTFIFLQCRDYFVVVRRTLLACIGHFILKQSTFFCHAESTGEHFCLEEIASFSCIECFFVMRRTLSSCNAEITSLSCWEHIVVMRRLLCFNMENTFSIQISLHCHVGNIVLLYRGYFFVMLRTLLSCRDHFIVKLRTFCCHADVTLLSCIEITSLSSGEHFVAMQRLLCCNMENTFVLQRSLHCQAENISL